MEVGFLFFGSRDGRVVGDFYRVGRFGFCYLWFFYEDRCGGGEVGEVYVRFFYLGLYVLYLFLFLVFRGVVVL